MPEEYKQKIERLVERRHGLDHERPILLHKQLTEDEMSVRDNTRTQSVPQVLPTFTQLKINSDLRNRTNNQISETLIEAEEKQKQKEAQERFANMTDEERKAWVQEQWDKTEGLGEADSATDWYYAIEEDPQKRAEWDRNAETVSSIGATIATLPFTAGLGIRGGKHALNVLFNPMKAKTAAGTAAAMTLDVYLGYKGLEHAANTIDKWRNGNFDWEDIPNFGLGVMGTIPGISHGMNAYRNATNMFNAANQINKAKKIASKYYDPVYVKAMSNETVNAPGNAEPIPLDKNAFIINQQQSGKLQSHNPSKLTREELMGLPKGERASYQVSLGKSKITPEERVGIPKGERNNGKYNGITFFRTLDQVPDINSDGFVDLTSPFNTFLNTTSDDLVHLHSMYPYLKKHALAIDPEAFRGSTLTTLDPSDHVFIRETVKVKPKHVTLITGDPEAITLAQQRGFNVVTSPKLKIYWQRGANRTHGYDYITTNSKGERELLTPTDSRNLYDEEIRKLVTTNFSRPKINIYENLSKQTGLPLKTQSFSGKNFVKPYPGVLWSPSDFKYVVYDPASPAEQFLMRDYGLNVITDSKFNPSWKTSDSWGDRMSWINIRQALDKMKQNIKPLKQGGKL